MKPRDPILVGASAGAAVGVVIGACGGALVALCGPGAGAILSALVFGAIGFVGGGLVSRELKP